MAASTALLVEPRVGHVSLIGSEATATAVRRVLDDAGKVAHPTPHPNPHASPHPHPSSSPNPGPNPKPKPNLTRARWASGSPPSSDARRQSSSREARGPQTLTLALTPSLTPTLQPQLQPQPQPQPGTWTDTELRHAAMAIVSAKKTNGGCNCLSPQTVPLPHEASPQPLP